MTTTTRWVGAILIVAAAFALVFALDPTTCNGDQCSANAPLDFGICVVAVVAAILVLTVRRR